jgi:L-aminopeptidase/D-esterase-like protein
VVAGEATVGALAVVNACGDVLDRAGAVLAGSQAGPGAEAFPDPGPLGERTSTTLVVIATDARLTKAECGLVAQSAHHGLARAVHPSHTRYDGDLAIVVATGGVAAHLDRLRVAATEVVEAAVRDAVEADDD